jgi:hypothetical protein
MLERVTTDTVIVMFSGKYCSGDGTAIIHDVCHRIGFDEWQVLNSSIAEAHDILIHDAESVSTIRRKGFQSIFDRLRAGRISLL